jgi:parallel beta-helix repeat protein
MTLARLSPYVRQREWTNLGVVSPGAKLYTYLSGSSTPADTWTTQAMAVKHANPVQADAYGLFPEIFLTPGVTYRMTLTDSLGNVIWGPNDGIATGGSVSALAGASFDVTDYGAVGDGSTDDTTAFQNAIAALIANTGGVLYIPNGTYRLTAQLTITCSNASVVGESREGAILKWDDLANKGLKFDLATVDPYTSALTANVALGARSVTIASATHFAVGQWVFLDDNTTYNGSLTTRIHGVSGTTITLEDAAPNPFTTAGAATLYTYVLHPFLEGIVVSTLTLKCAAQNPTNMLTLLQLSRCNAYRVDNVHFIGSTQPLVTVQGCYRGSVTRSLFEYGSTVANTGIEHQTSTGCSVEDCTFTMCQFGITFSASPYGRSVGNLVDGRATTVALGRGIKYADASNFGVIDGNTVSDTNLFGIYLQDSSYCTVSGNSLSFGGVDPAEHGIQVGGFLPSQCVFNTISGNTIVGFSGYGVSVNPTAASRQDLYCTVVGNAIYNCAYGGVAFANAGGCIAANNTVYGLGATVVGGFIRCASGAGYNIITGNNLKNGDTNGSTGVKTNGGDGHNFVDANISSTFLTDDLAATDSVGATQAYVLSKVTKAPINTGTAAAVATGANTNLTTAWTVAIPAGALTAVNQGFRMRGVFTLADNTNVKNLFVVIGTATFQGVSDTAGGFQVEFVLEAQYKDGTTANCWCQFFGNRVSSLQYMPGATYAAATVDWAAGFNIVVSMQNGSASANDIIFRMGKLSFEGVPQG